jgi:hypothetical protein
MPNRFLSIGRRSLSAGRLQRRLIAVRAAARLKRQSFPFNIEVHPASGGANPCGADNRTWWRELWLQSLRDPTAYKIQDLRDYGLTDSPTDLPPLPQF